MSEMGEMASVPMSALLVVLQKEDDPLSSLIRLAVFALIFIGPAIIKAIRESARKKRELAERAGGGRMELAQEEEAPETEVEEPASEGREQWERLLRGEETAPPPPMPPAIPLPQPPPMPPIVLARPRASDERPTTAEESAPERRVLTRTEAHEVATPERSLEDPRGYDGVHRPKLGLGREFKEFAAREGLASDRGGGQAKRVGGRATFAGADEFQSLASAAAPSEVSHGEIGGVQDYDVTAARAHSDRGMSRAVLKRSLVMAEILGPPVGSRPFDSGPTRPLGWS
jgi:hypothetical protein